ncbi:class I SAM-dependent methyltransferase [Brevibacillus sp. HB1.2]|uniref:class I SAM-dependent methyltransferase n=1 Tax=Brevibacillus sp. HB1.2 TaxID=2738807 RepID=UPI001576AFF2|nr:class I SAM-dependent methyltransferase [Brevibacillus sp. HB1.2]
MSIRDSRFIVNTDEKDDHFIFTLPVTWNSRPYEYAWAKQFANPNDVVLDSACGICHPFKFYLADQCREVHACDLDNRILYKEAIYQDIVDVFGKRVADSLPAHYFDGIHYCRANLTYLPYPNQKFDTVFCISVLEHLEDPIMVQAFREFHRVLKDDGQLVLTFDYPLINLARLQQVLAEVGLQFSSDVSFEMPADVVYSDLYAPRLFFFRALLKKK